MNLQCIWPLVIAVYLATGHCVSGIQKCLINKLICNIAFVHVCRYPFQTKFNSPKSFMNSFTHFDNVTVLPDVNVLVLELSGLDILSPFAAQRNLSQWQNFI